MVKQSSLYITLSAEGIWYYQRWMTKHFRSFNLDLRPVFRLSLRTKNKKRASRLSRVISVKIDKLALEHFDDPDDFSRGMKLLYESVAALTQAQSFEDYEENFLMDLDDLDEWLLSKATRFNHQIQSEFSKLQDEVTFLKKALLNSTSNTTAEDLKELLHPSLPDGENPTLEELFTLWQEGNSTHLVKTSFKNNYKSAISLFIRFVTEYDKSPVVRINALTPGHIRHYHKYYAKIPKGVQTTKYSISELIQLKGTEKSPKTIQDNYSYIGTFLNWITRQGHPINPSLQGVLTKGNDIRPDKNKEKQRNPLSDDELKKLFNSEKYTKTGKFKTSAMYWAALISLYTGARMSEILQLERHDIKNESDIWVFNFDDVDFHSSDSKKHIKNDDSRRLVPIHKQLLDLGFIDYVKTIVKGKLFPDEPRNDKGKFDAFQKRHTTYRKQVSVVPAHQMELKDFHSFRHTVRTRLSDIRTTGRASQQFDEGTIDSILGHASKGRSIGQTTYNHSQYIAAKKKALDRLHYPSIDFESIIKWSKCEFHRESLRKSRKRQNTPK